MRYLSLREIELQLIKELKDRANDLAIDELVISSTIWNFLDEFEKKKIQHKSKSQEEKNFIISGNKSVWDQICNDYDINMRAFNKKISKLVKDKFKRKIIMRDVAHAYIFAKTKFFKEAVILSGGVIEELLRNYLKNSNIHPPRQSFVEYIKACEGKGLLKSGISRFTDFVRQFRNLVHLEREKNEKHTISKSAAKGAVSAIFTLVNDF